MTDCNCPKCQALPTKHRLADELEQARLAADRNADEWQRVADERDELVEKAQALADQVARQYEQRQQFLDLLRRAADLLKEYGSCDPYTGQPYDDVVEFLDSIKELRDD